MCITCKKCLRETQDGESTGTFNIMKIWTDKEGREHKDTVRSYKVCMNCRGERIIK